MRSQGIRRVRKQWRGPALASQAKRIWARRVSARECVRRAANSAGASLAARRLQLQRWQQTRLSAECSRRGAEDCQRMNRRDCRMCAIRKEGAVRRRRKEWPSTGRRLDDAHCRLSSHRAVMPAIAAAACRQTGGIAAAKRGRERPQSEEQHQQDGKCAPHLA